MTPDLEDRIRSLPDRPGIYVFTDDRGRTLYVGKAKSLRKRVVSYLRDLLDARLRMMVAEAIALEYVVTDTESEALLLENNWIKSKRPRYNILLRDDKTYPYLQLTVQEEFPRIVFTRRVANDGAAYFGPYLPGGVARRAIKLVQRLFQVRVCHIPIDGSLPRPCLYHDLKRCLGPCVDGLTTKADYDEAVERAQMFLAGRSAELVRRLRRDMKEASEDLEYERAARLRDTLAEIEVLGGRQNLSSVRGEDVDVYGCHLAGGNAAVVVLVMRSGQILDRRELFWEGESDVSQSRLLSELLPQIYDRTTFIPKEIHLPEPIEGDSALANWLSERKGQKVYLRFPSRGPKARRLDVAIRNARLAHKRRFRGQGAGEVAAEALAKALGLPDPPSRIEGFDISHFQGESTVASMVVWEAGTMRKTDYRTFSIRELAGPDDVASLRQAVFRRYRRVLAETGALPDLVLIDGGRGQLNAALEALGELGIEETPVVALAKREEEVFVPGRPEPLRLARRDPALQLLQAVRDEAHRFAVGRHRRSRRKRRFVSKLDHLSGIGTRRKRLLLQRFGSFGGVFQAGRSELQEVLGPLLGMRIFGQLHDAGDASDKTVGPVEGVPR